MPLAPAETVMWEKPTPQLDFKSTDADINARYEKREQKIIVEANREKLQNFYEALKRPNYMVIRPFYQRRLRWDAKRQSRFIESFIVNIPIPPLFLYEASYNSYEVVDGQQRITAIQNFYSGELRLEGLQHWPELNGRSYSTLPSKIRAGIDRRSISYVVVLKESAESDEDALLLKQIVFERLNTGGVKFSNQEVRNGLYHGEFNRLLFKLAADPVFREAWELPPPTEGDEEHPSKQLLSNPFYTAMKDVEVVLRFFALRHHENYQRGMQGFLDLYMIRSQHFDRASRDFLRNLFLQTIRLAHQIYGKLLFRPYAFRKERWSKRPQKAFADAVMVGISELLDHAPKLIEHRERIIEATREMFLTHPEGIFTGCGNTKHDVKKRIAIFSRMLGTFCSGK